MHPLRKAVLLPLSGHCYPGNDHGGIKENNQPIYAPHDMPRLWHHPGAVSAVTGAGIRQGFEHPFY